MNPLCEKCKGACCETWVVSPFNYEQPAQVVELLEGRSAGEAGHLIFLHCRCRHLTAGGRCGIYETRPTLCRTFEPGGADCLRTLAAVRPELLEEGKQYGRRHGTDT